MGFARAFPSTAVTAPWHASTAARLAGVVRVVVPRSPRGRHPTTAVSCLVPRSVQRQFFRPTPKRGATRTAARQRHESQPPPSDDDDDDDDDDDTGNSLRARWGQVPARCISGPKITI